MHDALELAARLDHAPEGFTRRWSLFGTTPWWEAWGLETAYVNSVTNFRVRGEWVPDVPFDGLGAKVRGRDWEDPQLREDLVFLRKLGVTTIEVDCGGQVSEVSALADYAELDELRVVGIYGDLPDLSVLEELSIRRLVLRGASSVPSGWGLTNWGALEVIAIDRCPVESLTELDAPGIRHIAVALCNTLTDLVVPKGLRTLRVAYCANARLDGLAGASLVDLQFSGSPAEDFSTLSSLRGLERLELSGCKGFGTAEVLPSGLHELDVRGCEALADLGALANQTTLRRLRMSDLPELAALEPLSELPLTSLELVRCPGVTSLSSLAMTPLRLLVVSGSRAAPDKAMAVLALAHDTLERLEARNLGALTRVELACPALKSLDLGRCPHLPDVGFVSGTPNLETLNIGSCSAVSDLSPLSGLGLRALDVGNTGIQTVEVVASLPELRTLVAHNCRQLQHVNLAHDRLESIDLRECPIESHELADCPDLRTVMLPR